MVTLRTVCAKSLFARLGSAVRGTDRARCRDRRRGRGGAPPGQPPRGGGARPIHPRRVGGVTPAGAHRVGGRGGPRRPFPVSFPFCATGPPHPKAPLSLFPR